MAYVGTPIDTTNQFQSLVGKRFSGDASTTAFTLDVAPSSTLDIEVFVENVRQDPNSAYSLSGTTLTFAAAPPSGTNNIYVVHQAKAVGTISPAAGTVNADSFDNTVISGHTALATKPDATDEFLVSDAGTIKRIDYSLLTPISTAVVYRVTTSFSDAAIPISSNIEKADDGTAGAVGDVTNNSGVFTFANTGVYYVAFTASVYGDGATDNQVNFNIQGTPDNSTFDTLAEGLQGADDGKQHVAHASAIFDCTNTSTHKVRFTVSSSGSSIQVQGSTSANQTYFTFIRLGDT